MAYFDSNLNKPLVLHDNKKHISNVFFTVDKILALNFTAECDDYKSKAFHFYAVVN